ncbi:MAG: hypothetical protein IJM33_06040 [Bacteroidales bacterium]|nr:hypothetical protein [Bacteroidales bacterium]
MKLKQSCLIILFALLGLTLTSCTKEAIDDGTYAVAAEPTVTYFVNGQMHSENLQSEMELAAFFDRMLALAEEGYQVRIRRNDIPQQVLAAKEKVTFTTTSYAEAKAWANKKVNEGYEVTMTFNQETGEYTCIAIR